MVKPGMFAKYHTGVHAGAVAGEEAGPRLDWDLPLAASGRTCQGEAKAAYAA